MVDAAHSHEPAASSAATGSLRADAVFGRDAARGLIAALPDDVIVSGYQHPVFLRAWLEHTPHQPVFIRLAAEGYGPVVLPLERAAGRLSYIGERHANGNFPLGRSRDIVALAECGHAAIARALRGLDLGARAIVLERQWETLCGIDNPFVSDASSTSPNPALSMSLEGGFDEVLKRHSAKRRRKRFRNQERRLDAMGGHIFVPRVARDDVAATLERFFEMKAGHFEEAGIGDVFAEDYVKRFFVSLFEAGLDRDRPTHELKVLEVAGKPIAIIGCTVQNDRLTVEFGTYDAAYGEVGPGDMLFFLAIREAAEKGLGFFDFGIGDEPYKRGWCEIEMRQRDTIIPLTARGHLVSWAKTGRNSLVRSLKSNRTLWRTAKRIRRHIPLSR